GRLSRGRDLLRRRLSRRRGVVLPLFVFAAPAVPDPLVSATLETTTAKAAPASRATALADSALGRAGRRLGLFLFLLTAGVVALAAWQARALAGRAPTNDSPVAPAATPATPAGGCHAS